MNWTLAAYDVVSEAGLKLIKRFERNTRGRDIAVGDIHGHFSRLEARLIDVGFNPAVDRLFSVGDLVDRGPESEKALDWLSRPWFHAVRGNHEDIAIRYAKGNPVDRVTYSRNGGDWFMALDEKQQQQFKTAFEVLPYAIEVDTKAGLVGLLHANCPVSDWADLEIALMGSRYHRDKTIWDRSRIEYEEHTHVTGIHAIIAGHTPVKRTLVLGNVHHIDTGGWTSVGLFTLLDLDTLQPM